MSVNIKRPSNSRLARLAQLKIESKKKKLKSKIGAKIKKRVKVEFDSESETETNKEREREVWIQPKITTGVPIKLGNGPPEENWEDAPDGAIYVEEETADVYLHAEKLGWVQLNGWCPDIGEENPNEENPPDPMTGDMYVNVLTADLFYFVEGFGWVLINGLIGPQGPEGQVGPIGPAGFADVFYAITGKEIQELTIDPVSLVWEIPEFQDTDYHFLDDLRTLRITNCGIEPARYQVQIKLSICRKDNPTKLLKSGVEFYLQQDGKVVPGSLTYAMLPCAGNHSVFINVIVEVHASSEIDLTIEGRVTGSGEICILQDGSNCWQVVKLG